MWRNKIVEVAKDKENADIQFAIAKEDDFAADMKTVLLDDSGEEINVALWDADGRRFKMEPEDDFDSDSLRDFINAWRNSELWGGKMGTCMEKMRNLISGKFCFWREIFAILRGNVSFRCIFIIIIIFLSFSSQKI